MSTNVAFHIGRGGRFHNSGYKTFNLAVERLEECFENDCSIISDDPETGEKLPDEEWQLVNGSGREILRGRKAIESETGVLDWDGDYDTDIVKDIEDCDDDELMLVFNGILDGKFVNPDIVQWLKRNTELIRK